MSSEKKYSNLTNDELLDELQKNLNDNDLLFQEIVEREEAGLLKKPQNLLNETLMKKK